MVRICDRDKTKKVKDLAAAVNFTDFLNRDINAGYSGGEIKRSELLRFMAQDPDLMLFDKPESGVDLENISLIGNSIAALLRLNFQAHTEKTRKQTSR